MKKVIYIAILLIVMVISFAWGKSSVKPHNADALLAYEHYFESAERMFQDCNCKVDSFALADYEIAKQQIDSITKSYVLEWPEIIDQRDQLSDVIRVLKDNHPELIPEIDDYLRTYYPDPDIIYNWVYSY